VKENVHRMAPSAPRRSDVPVYMFAALMSGTK
jgi:hypothetical protein